MRREKHGGMFGGRMRAAVAAAAVTACSAAAGVTLAPEAFAATPSVAVTTASTAMTATTNFSASNATATCPAGTTLVSGGDNLTRGGTPVTNDGSVTLGVYPSSSGGTQSANGDTNPLSWTAEAGYSGMAPGLDTLTSYAICATSVTSATQVVVASAPANSLGPVTAVCPSGKSLVGGGGGYTGFPVGVSNNTKIYDSFPSDAAGDLPANGSSNPTAWTVLGNSNSATGANTSAVALCATDVTVPTEVATNTTSATTVAGGAPVTATATCPAGTNLLGGGSDIVSNPSGPGTGGQGVHVIADYPSDASANPITSGSAQSWTVTGMDGGQNLTSLATETLVLCAPIPAPPTAPAVVTGAASAITTSGAGLAGTVNSNGLATNYTFEYGPSTSFGSITTVLGAGSGSSAVPESATLTGLAANTTYDYRLVATSSAGTTFGSVASFTTAGDPQKPLAVTGASSAITTDGATVAGQVDPDGQATAFAIEYGPTETFGSLSTVTELDNATSLEDVSATLTGLSADTTYYYRTVADNASGTTAGVVMTFNTGPGGSPIVSTGASSGVSAGGATLAATVDPHGSQTAFTFEYGTTTNFGSLTAVDNAGSGDGAESVTLPVSGLAPSTTYVYRIVASNANGTTAGSVSSFTTSP